MFRPSEERHVTDWPLSESNSIVCNVCQQEGSVVCECWSQAGGKKAGKDAKKDEKVRMMKPKERKEGEKPRHKTKNLEELIATLPRSTGPEDPNFRHKNGYMMKFLSPSRCSGEM